VDLFVVAVVARNDQGSKFASYTAALTSQSLLQVERATTTTGVKKVREFRLADAPAVDLPAGPATYHALHIIYPAGYTSKHVHGGPSFIYVISGVFQIIDDKGTRTFHAGTFDFEPPAHVHTFHVIQAGTAIFSLRFLPPGAEATIPVK
jgi:quercetin dioxygenase-like cupin family protein